MILTDAITPRPPLLLVNERELRLHLARCRDLDRYRAAVRALEALNTYLEEFNTPGLTWTNQTPSHDPKS